MAVVAGALREYLRDRITHLRRLRRTLAVQHELVMAAQAFVFVTELELKKAHRSKVNARRYARNKRRLKLVKDGQHRVA